MTTGRWLEWACTEGGQDADNKRSAFTLSIDWLLAMIALISRLMDLSSASPFPSTPNAPPVTRCLPLYHWLWHVTPTNTSPDGLKEMLEHCHRGHGSLSSATGRRQQAGTVWLFGHYWRLAFGGAKTIDLTVLFAWAVSTFLCCANTAAFDHQISVLAT